MSDAALAATGAMPLNAMLVRRGGEPQSINLTEKFGAGYTFTVEGTNGAAVAATVGADGVLTLEFGELGHSDIRIVATDAAGGTVTDGFRVRVAGENAYTIAVIPDTQDYTDTPRITHIFGDMMQWLVDNKDSLGIQFVTHVGDVTQHNFINEWTIAEAAMRKLDGEIPYSLLPGNHDLGPSGSAVDRSQDNLSTYFPVAEQSKLPGFGGVYDKEPQSFANNWFTFTAPDGTKWLSLSLEFGPRDDVLRWAGEVIEGHLDHRVMLTTHGYMAGDGRVGSITPQLTGENAGPSYGVGNSVEGASDGDGIWSKLVSKYPNISFTFSGHNFIDGAETQIDYNAAGEPVLQMLVNYQNGIAREITGNGNPALGSNGGNGAIRLITIDPENDAVYTETYFTDLDDYLDGFRTKEALDRDGLTGSYRGHQEEFQGIDLSNPTVNAYAKAGSDLVVEAAEGDAAAVTLDASRSILPEGAEVTYAWKDADGRVVATGIKPTLELGSGLHRLTLEVTGADGFVSRDAVLVTVKGEGTLLADNFNDGDATGWSAAGTVRLADYGTPQDFALPAMSGGQAELLAFPKYTAQQFLKLDLPQSGAAAGGKLSSYTFVMDLLIPKEADWLAFFQTDAGNASDAEFYLRNDGDGTASLGISGNYQGDFQYGQWQRVAFSFDKQANGSTVIRKYIDGAFIGQQTDSGGRFDIDPAKGVLLFSDDGADTSRGYANSLLFSDRVLTATEIAGFGRADADGIASAAIAGATQFDFTGGKLDATFGTGKLSVPNAAVSTPLKVVGTALSGEADGEGTLKDLTNTGTNLLLWNEAAARQWQDYVYDITLSTNDNSGKIGVVFGYQDQQNHYRLTFDVDGNARTLVKVQGGVETVLATVPRGIVMATEVDLRVAMVGGEIRVLLDGHDVFGGPVVDAKPLAGGTIGVYSQTQDTASFDNVMVNRASLTAHGEGAARGLDTDGDGLAAVAVTAGASFGPDAITGYRWLLDGEQIGTGKDAVLSLPVGTRSLMLEITDATGRTATDLVKVETAAKDNIRLIDGFGGSLADWRLVSEGENGVAANWRIEGGRLVQDSDVASRQLTNNGNASNPNLWDSGWSPLGDGDYVLRKGAYALYEGDGAFDWKDYSVAVTLKAGGSDAMGLLFYYQDAKNYYKVELDGQYGVFQMVRLVDGIESVVSRTAGRFALDRDLRLSVDVKDHVIDVRIDGERVFENAIEDRTHPGGSFALYNWGAAGGVSYDDVTVVSLAGDILGTAGDDLLAGTAAADVIAGLAGDDALSGLAGGDLIDGGAGDDILDGGEGDDRLLGGAGDDALDGGAGDDRLEGGDGDDAIEGGDGFDTLVLQGAAGAILIDLASGQASAAGLGTDSFSGIEGFRLGAGDDVATLVAGAGPVGPIDGGAGQDRLVLTGSGTLGALTGIERLDLQGDWTVAGAGADITFQDRAQSLSIGRGFAGIISDFGQEDRIELAGIAASKVALGAGNLLTVTTADGPLTLKLDPADDYTGMAFTLEQNGEGGVFLRYAPANAGDDVFTGGNGADVYDGGAGDDVIAGGAGNDRLLGGAGDDKVDGGSGADQVAGGAGDDALKGGSGEDRIDGGDGDDTIDAGSDADTVDGGDGRDIIKGGSGNDVITGGAGDDLLDGGSGADRFIFGQGFGRDRIADFGGADIIQFDADLFASFAAVKDAARQVGCDVVITFDESDMLTLSGVALGSLSAEDFRFVA